MRDWGSDVCSADRSASRLRLAPRNRLEVAGGGDAFAGAPGAVAAEAAVAPFLFCRNPAADALAADAFGIESAARGERGHLGAEARLHRRVLGAAIASHRKFIHRLGEVSLPSRGRKAWKPGEPRRSARRGVARSEEHTSELQSLMRISYAVFCLKNKN